MTEAKTDDVVDEIIELVDVIDWNATLGIAILALGAGVVAGVLFMYFFAEMEPRQPVDGTDNA